MFSAIKEETIVMPEQKFGVNEDEEIVKVEQKFKEKYQISNKPLSSNFLQKRLQKGQKFFDSGDYNMAIANKNKVKASSQLVPDKNNASKNVPQNNYTSSGGSQNLKTTAVVLPRESGPKIEEGNIHQLEEQGHRASLRNSPAKEGGGSLLQKNKESPIRALPIDHKTMESKFDNAASKPPVPPASVSSPKQAQYHSPLPPPIISISRAQPTNEYDNNSKNSEKGRRASSMTYAEMKIRDESPELESLEDITGRVIPTPDNVPARKASIPILSSIGLPPSLKSTQQSHPVIHSQQNTSLSHQHLHNPSHRHSAIQ